MPRALPLLALVVGAAAAFELASSPGTLSWKYNDLGVALDGVNWAAPAYNDSAWAVGVAPLGFGGAVNTALSYGGSATSKRPTYYFRTTVTVPEAPSALTAAVVGVLAGDGGVVYINGVEVGRVNMGPQATVSFADAALASAPTPYTMQYFSVNPATVLVQGANTIAVEVHLARRDASQLRFDSFLLLSDVRAVPFLTAPPYVQFQSSSSAIVRWFTNTACDSQVRAGGPSRRLFPVSGCFSFLSGCVLCRLPRSRGEVARSQLVLVSRKHSQRCVSEVMRGAVVW